jgi:hypothetical protein
VTEGNVSFVCDCGSGWTPLPLSKAHRAATGRRWRRVEKLHNEKLHGLYSSPSIIRMIKSRRMRWVGHVAWMGEKRKVHGLLVGKPEGKEPLGRPRRS